MTFLVEILAEAAAVKAWEERASIRTFFGDAIEAAVHGKLRLFVFGCGGTGKSTFGMLMSGKKSLSEIGIRYDLSSSIEKHKIKGKYFASISIPPGQEDLRNKQWGQLFRDIQNSNRPLIINVTCFGYHSVDKLNLSEIPEFKNGLTESSMANFLNENRKREVKALETLVEGIKHFDKGFDLITLVSKQDLWWSRRKEVIDHYTSSTKRGYMHQVSKIQKVVGDGKFGHHIVSCSFGHINMRTADGVELCQIDPSYDAQLMYANLANFKNMLNAKIGQKK